MDLQMMFLRTQLLMENELRTQIMIGNLISEMPVYMGNKNHIKLHLTRSILIQQFRFTLNKFFILLY